MTASRVLAAVAIAAAIGGCGGKRSTFEPPAELTRIEQTLDVDRLWTARVGRGGEGLRLGLRPATDGVRVYAGSHDGRAAALDAGTGRTVWSTRTDLPLSAGPGYGQGLLAFGTSNGRLLVTTASP